MSALLPCFKRVNVPLDIVLETTHLMSLYNNFECDFAFP